ncbi:hypothetical protein JMJ78_0000189 [Colletotrichum scovillei]|nr:hypothetical protein JMJ78_0000189 [Colletotrichum scovillei]
MVDILLSGRHLEWVAQTEADDWLFLTSLITTLYLLYVACTTGVRFKKIGQFTRDSHHSFYQSRLIRR